MLRLSHTDAAGTKTVSDLVLSLAAVLEENPEQQSVWGRFKFSDLDAKKEALRHDVSIQVVPSLIDGNKVEYKPGMEHVALTGRPVIPGLGPWVEDSNDPLIATKELIFEGDFYKKADNLSFSAKGKSLDKLVDSVSDQIENLVRIPLQLGHSGDGNSKGELVGIFKAKRFHEVRKATALSLYKPYRPMTFLALALSVDAVNPKGSTMEPLTIDELINLLGVTVAEGATDDDKVAAVQAALKEYRDWKASQGETGTEGEGGETALSQQTQQPQRLAERLEPRKVQMTVAMSQVSREIASGKKLLDAYVMSGDITRAQADELLAKHNTPEKVKLSLSSNASTSDLQDHLDTLLSAKAGWRKNGRTELPNGRTADKLALSQGQGNPLLIARGITE